MFIRSHTFVSKLFVARVHYIELLVAQIFNIHHLISGSVDRMDQLIQFKVDRACVSVLSILNQEDHKKGNDGRTGVDDQLPGVGIMKDRSRRTPHDDYRDRSEKRPL